VVRSGVHFSVACGSRDWVDRLLHHSIEGCIVSICCYLGRSLVRPRQVLGTFWPNTCPYRPREEALRLGGSVDGVDG
jgi:hypothetical protein